MKKPRHVSDDAAESIMQEAGSRSVNTAMFATNVVAIQRQHGKVSRPRCDRHDTRNALLQLLHWLRVTKE